MLTCSVVIDNLDINGSAGSPSEADAKPIIDANAVPPRAVALERFQPIARRHAKIVKSSCSVQHRQLPHGHRFNRDEAPDSYTCKQRLCVGASERADRHPRILTRRVSRFNEPFNAYFILTYRSPKRDFTIPVGFRSKAHDSAVGPFPSKTSHGIAVGFWRRTSKLSLTPARCPLNSIPWIPRRSSTTPSRSTMCC